MKLPLLRIAAIVVVALIALVAGAMVILRSPAQDSCFDRLGGPGPNSNTPRLDTYLDISPNQWPAVAAEMKAFAAVHGWLVQEGGAVSDPTYASLDMCDSGTTFVRASNHHMGGRQIGFGIIHTLYEGSGADAWKPLYRDLHRRLEARWPGRLRYIGGEFMQPIDRPEWLGGAPSAPKG